MPRRIEESDYYQGGPLMNALTFGLHIPCPTCKGKGKKGLTPQGQRERGKEIAIAKRAGREAPPIQNACPTCEGAGYVAWVSPKRATP